MLNLSLSHRRFVSCIPRCRPFSSHPHPSFPAQGEPKGEGKTDGEWSTPKDPTFSVWKQTAGKQFEKPHRPCNWLGGKVPFPLNPSFKPPTPVSDALRSTLYRSFMDNPTTNSVRNLAGRYHLSMKRADAIIRLKGLEESWVKGKPLQTGFLKGMEQLLGVTYDASKHKTHQGWVQSRIQAVEADTLDQAEGGKDWLTRYQRMYWEPVAKGTDGILANVLKREREDAIDTEEDTEKDTEEDTKKDDEEIPMPIDVSLGDPELTHISSTTAGRPAIKFIDVGRMFARDTLRRKKESERRARVRSKKVAKRHRMAS